MIICHSRRFIFLHGRKTAGSSIGTSLNRFLADGDASMGYVGACRDAGITPPDWRKRWHHLRPWDLRRRKPGYAAYKRLARERHGITSTHMSALTVRQLLGKERWNDYFKFTFERHPVDRVISFYFWRTRLQKQPPSLIQFIECIEHQDRATLAQHDLLEYSNANSYCIDQQICVDFIGRFEQLKEQMSLLCSRIGVAWDGWLPNEKRWLGNQDERRAAQHDASIRARLADALQDEIKLLGYGEQA